MGAGFSLSTRRQRAVAMTQSSSAHCLPSAKASPATSSKIQPSPRLAQHPACPQTPLPPQLTPRKVGSSSHPSSEGSEAAVPDPRNNREKALGSTRGQQTLGAGTQNRRQTAWQALCKHLHCKIQAGCSSTSNPQHQSKLGSPTLWVSTPCPHSCPAPALDSLPSSLMKHAVFHVQDREQSPVPPPNNTLVTA